MEIQKFSVNQQLIETVLAWVKSGEIAIPEIQRPFVWDSTKVRDLIDSLYNGYPIGYLISWKNPNIKLKDGRISEGKKILIDGQQRVKALTAALLGRKVINKDYKLVKMKIAFNPIEEKFEVFNPAIEKDAEWIPDISKIISGEISILDLIDYYCKKNQNINQNELFKRIDNIIKIPHKQIGHIELSSSLDIETVTEIFIRVNSKGIVLSQADFVMSKIASSEEYGGTDLRKCIDYFCHLSVAPEFFNNIIELEKDFVSTKYFKSISWLKDEKEDLYDPKYTDLLRVAFTSEFHRGRLVDLVSLLSGRNFETRDFEEEIVIDSFKKLDKGILNFINETNFKKFVMIIKSAGFIDRKLIRSQNTINFAYILYLTLRYQNYNPAEIERYVRRWFVLSILTGRYSASPETMFDFDIKNISKRNFSEYLDDVEKANLSDAFWDFGLVQRLETSVSSSPIFNVYLAAQVKNNDKGFLSKEITVKDLIELKGDVHHIFPRDYLKKYGLKRAMYNQVANYVYMQSEINISIGNKSPNIYFSEINNQINGEPLKYGGITDKRELMENLRMNCIPENIFSWDINNYDEFLEARRKLISQKIRDYYFSL